MHASRKQLGRARAPLLPSALLMIMALASGASAGGVISGLGGFRWATATPQGNTLNAVSAAIPKSGGLGLVAVGDSSTYLQRLTPYASSDERWLSARGRRIRADVDYLAVDVLRSEGLVAVTASDGTVLAGLGSRMVPVRVAEAPLRAAAWTRVESRPRLAVAGDSGAAFFSDDAGERFEPAALPRELPAPPAFLGIDAPEESMGTAFAAARILGPNGSYGAVLKTQDGGKSWVVSAEFPTLAACLDVSFLSDAFGYALGLDRERNTLLLRTTDGGREWTPVALGDGSVRTIAAAGAERVILAGDGLWLFRGSAQPEPVPLPVAGLAGGLALNGVDAAGDEAWAVGRHGAIFRSSDQGATWEAFTRSRQLDARSLEPLNAIQYLSEKDVLVAGGNGAILRSNDAGGSFVPMPTPTSADLFALAVPGMRNPGTGEPADGPGVAVGAGRTILRHDPNEGWRSRGSVPGVTLRDAHIADEDGKVTTWAVGDGGVIVYQPDGQALWTRSPAPAGENLRSIHGFASPSGLVMMAVGDGGAILSWRDGGPWKRLTTLPTPVATRNLRGVFLRSASTAFVVGDGGLVARTLNGGDTWTVLSVNTVENLHAVSAAGEEVVAVGESQAVLYSPNGGTAFTLLPPPVPGNPPPDITWRGVHVAGPGHVFIAGDAGRLLEAVPGAGWTAKNFSATETCWALSMDGLSGLVVLGGPNGARVASTTDGWKSRAFASLPPGTPALFGCDVLGARTVVVGASGAILASADGLAGAPAYRSRSSTLRAVVSPTVGVYLAAGDDGTLLRSEDDGVTWNEVKLDLDGPVSFRAMAFFEPNAGIARGYLGGVRADGTAVLLYTRDGKVWIDISASLGSGAPGIHGLAAFSGMVLAAAEKGLAYLYDGIRWHTQQPLPGFSGTWKAVSATDGRWYLVGEAGRAARYPDAAGKEAWQELFPGTRHALNAISAPPVPPAKFGLFFGGGDSLRDDVRGVCTDPAGVLFSDTGGLSLFGDVNRTRVNAVDGKAVLAALAGNALPSEEVLFFGDLDPPAPDDESLPGNGSLSLEDAASLLRVALGM